MYPSSKLESSRLDRGGLKVGTRAPDFNLPDLTATRRSLREFRGKRVLLVFAGPECGPCQKLTPELVPLYQRHRGNNLEIVMISRGDHEANQAKADKHGVTFPILLQHRWEISKEYAIFALPAGYLIDERGIIAKEVAIGAERVPELVYSTPPYHLTN